MLPVLFLLVATSGWSQSVTAHTDETECGAADGTATLDIPAALAPNFIRINGTNYAAGTTPTITGLAVGATIAYDLMDIAAPGTIISSGTLASGVLQGPDTQVPVINGCPADITVHIPACETQGVATWTEPTITDACDASPTLDPASQASGTMFTGSTGAGTTTTVTYDGRDHAAVPNAAVTCTFNVTVIIDPNQAPVITCPADVAVEIPACDPSVVVNYAAPTATDDCTPVASLIYEKVSGISSGDAISTIGTYPVTYKVYDQGTPRLSHECTFNVVVTKAAAPALAGGAVTNTTAPIAQCATTTSLTYTTTAPAGGCAPVVLENITGLESGSTVIAGTYTITAKWRDAAGQTVEVPQTIVVAPAPAPPALVGGSITNTSAAELTDCNTSGTLTYTLVPPTGGCGTIVLENVTGLASGSTVVAGSYPITATWRDAAGQVSAPATITITIAPSITCAAAVGQVVNKVDADCNLTNGSMTINSSGTALPTGVCYFLRVEKQGSPNVIGSTGTPGSYTVSGLAPGNYTVTGQVYDCNTLAVLDVRVNTVTIGVKPDVAPPTVVACAAPAAVTEGACGAPVAIAYADATFTDNCTPAANLIVDRVGPANGSSLTAGTYKVIFTASDLSGNKRSCSIDVVVNKFVDNVAPVLTACPADINTTVACGALATINYTAPTATDNCPVSPVTVVQTGPASGSQLDPGVYPVVFTATDAAGNATTCSFTITVTNDQTGSLTCLGAVNVTLPTSCTKVLTANDVLPNGACVTGATVEVKRGLNWGSATLTKADIGQTLEYRVSRGTSMCWGTVKVEDKNGPSITLCVPDIEVACGTNTNDLAIVGDFKTGGANNGTATDCSTFEQSYTDDVTLVGTCGEKTIIRTWSLKDKWGNFSSDVCKQKITVKAPVTGVVDANNKSVSCTTDLTGFATAQGDGGTLYRPTMDGVAIKTLAQAGACDVYAILKAVMITDICGGGKSYMRTWQVIQKCTGAPVGAAFDQIVEVKDVTNPTATIKVDNYKLNKNTAKYCFTMGSMKMEDQETFTRVYAPETKAVGSADINIVGIADQSMCLAAGVKFTLSDIDATNCAGFTKAANVIVTDPRLTKNGNTYSGTFMFSAANEVQSFKVIITDDCGNKIEQTVNVSYEDNAAPNAICKSATLQLPAGSCTARLNVASINNNSTDNCGIKSIMMRKMSAATGTGTANCWSDVLDYSSEEACATDNMVILRVVDNNDIVSECMVPVIINLKPSIACEPLTEISRPCTSNDLLDFKALFADPTTGFTSSHPCVKPVITEDNLSSLVLNIGCAETKVTRKWKATATYCSAGETKTLVSTECSQVLKVTPVPGFRVKHIADENLTCASFTFDKAKEEAKVVESFDLKDCNGNKTCAAPVVDATLVREYSSSQYCKIYQIRYTIVDHCVTPTPSGFEGQSIWGYKSGSCTDLATESTTGTAYIQDRGNAIVFERFIYVNDTKAPTSENVVLTKICDGDANDKDADGCEFGFSTTLGGSDNCDNNSASSVPAKLYHMWKLQKSNAAGVFTDVYNGSTLVGGTNTDITMTNLAFGTYRIVYRVSDLCGNMSGEYTTTVTGADCKAPEILVHSKIVELAGQVGVRSTGMATLNYTDIDNRITDNCPTYDLTDDASVTMEYAGAKSATNNGTTTAGAPTATVGTRTVMFTCDRLGVQLVRVWAKDASNNWNYAVSEITVQDNLGICGGSLLSVAGGARTEANAVVNNITVSASANGAAISSADVLNGAFSLSVPAATNVQVRAAKNNNDDAASGVTTFDIAKVSQHVLDIEKLATPYKLIAGDVDKSGEIDATDMLHMRRFILKITPALPGGNFRFVDKAYSFRNAANPFGEDFPEVVSIATLTSNASANFVAVKLGDVNDSYAALAPRSSRTLSFLANDMNVVAGNEYTVNISADKMDAAAFQGTFSFNGATVKSVKAGDLANMTDGNFGVFANAVTTSWNGKTQASAEVLAITFVATKSGKLSEMLTINSELTQAVANDATGAEMNVNLKFNTGKVAGGEFALYQNQPNPVANETTIGFNLPKDGTARLTVTAVDGKVVKVINGDYKAGYNTISVNKSDLNATGVFYYRLETADHSASKKMVIIE